MARLSSRHMNQDIRTKLLHRMKKRNYGLKDFLSGPNSLLYSALALGSIFFGHYCHMKDNKLDGMVGIPASASSSSSFSRTTTTTTIRIPHHCGGSAIAASAAVSSRQFASSLPSYINCNHPSSSFYPSDQQHRKSTFDHYSYKSLIPLQSMRKQRRVLRVYGGLTDQGRKIDYSKGAITVKRVLGEGSYGIVYQGEWQKPSGGKEDVVLKRIKYNVEDADTMAHFEHLFNAHLSKAAKGAIAEFIGYFNVEYQTDSAIPTGKWLVWKYEGDKTLSYFLNHRHCYEALGEELGVSVSSVLPTTIKQVLKRIQKLHKVGIIHRDIKPSNIIFVDKKQELKLIDLGACADLRKGTNYVPDESILDPLYCPPEDFVLPTTTPDLSKQSSVVSMAMAPILWSRHMPDRFDTYSVGIMLMQLALPALRSDQGLRNFNMALKRARYDLPRWRKTQRGIPESEFHVLDINDGAGFDFASSLLRERGGSLGSSSSSSSSSGGSGIFNSLRRSSRRSSRMGIEEALKHPFLATADIKPTKEEIRRYQKRQREAASVSKKGGGGGKDDSRKGGGGLFWRLFDLEARLNIKASSTERQTLKVKRLERDVKSGKGSEKELQDAKKTLKVMEKNLDKLLTDFQEAADDAKMTIESSPSSSSPRRITPHKNNINKMKKTDTKAAAGSGGATTTTTTTTITPVDDLEIENQRLKEKLKLLESRLESPTSDDKKKQKQQGSSSLFRKRHSKPSTLASAAATASSLNDDDDYSRSSSSSSSYDNSKATSNRFLVEKEERREQEQQVSDSEAIGRAASNLLKFGMGFSGLALKVAGDIALDLRNTALKSLQQEQQRQQQEKIDNQSQDNKSSNVLSSSSSSTTTTTRTSSSKEEDLKIEPDVDGAEARSILAANPQDLSPAEIVSGTKKLTKFKSVIKTNLKAQGMFVDQKKAEITEISSKSNPYQERNDDSSSTLKEKMNTLQWLKTVQANMRQEYKAVMEKIEEMEKALESMAEEVRIKS